MLTGEKHLLLILKENGKLPLGGSGMGLKNWCPSTVLTDLRLRGKIELFDSGRKKNSVHIRAIDESSAGHPLLDEYLDIIKDFKSKKGETTQSVVDWVKWFRDKYKKKGYTEESLWDSLEKKGVLKNQGKKHILLKPEIKEQLYNDVRQVVMHKKEPDAELKALTAYAKYGHGWRYYANRSERDIAYSKALIRTQIIATITFFEIVVEKRKQIGGAVQAGSTAIGNIGSSALAASNYATDVFVEGKSQQEATAKFDNAMNQARSDFSDAIGKAEYESTDIRLKKKKEE